MDMQHPNAYKVITGSCGGCGRRLRKAGPNRVVSAPTTSPMSASSRQLSARTARTERGAGAAAPAAPAAPAAEEARPFPTCACVC